MVIDQRNFLEAIENLSASSKKQPPPIDSIEITDEQTMCELYNSSVHFLTHDTTQFGDEYLPYPPFFSSGYSSSISSFTNSSSSSVTSETSSSRSFFTASDRFNSPLLKPKKHRVAKHDSVYHDQDNESMASLLDSNKRDYYGFKRPTQWVNVETLYRFDRDYRKILNHQSCKWNQLLTEYGGELPPFSSKLKRYARKGVPRHLRGKAWMHYSGAKAKMDAHPNEYKILLEKATEMGKSNPHAEVIYRDLHRTFPDNTYFSCAVPQPDGTVAMIPESNPRLCALQRVLLAFSVHSPNIGYCQSLNFLAGFFLLSVEDEEEAFWILETTVNDIYPENMFDDSMDGSAIDQTVLMQLVYEKMPAVWNKLSNKRCFWECVQDLPPVTLVTNHWFLTLFLNILPIETVARVWDCVFVEGYKVLFRVALAIIKLSEESICAAEDPTDALQLLQNIPKRLLDCHEFMQYVFSKSGISNDLTYRDIESRRSMFRNRRLQRIPVKPTFSSPSSAGLSDTWSDDDIVEQIYL
ncbi:rab-GTPase-TBC domain-containing protein [Fennellomyces sp. T-0311]|nr:rab-GTPase-TBC domain-containing protein [Fennellomyces sp. T-0311]